MKFFVLIFIFFLSLQKDFASTNIPGGNVSGTWATANTPYLINGDIIVPNDSTLIIQPGVSVIFQDHYKFIIEGRLIAIGTQTDTIIFTAQNHTTGWHGIHITNIPTSNDSTIFEYCKFEYGIANSGISMEDISGGAVYCNGSKVRISRCLFRYNESVNPALANTGGGAISISGGNPAIEYCEFYENYSDFGSAIVFWGSSITPLIRNNYFHNNSGHGLINIGFYASPILVNNYIVNNNCSQHGFIHFSDESGGAVIINNTISYNTGGDGAIFLKDGSEPIFINNIIWGNTPAQVDLEKTSALSFYNCLIEGGLDEFTGRNNFSGQYQNCINSNPLFENRDECLLQNNSPCIGAGLNRLKIGSVTYSVPFNDFYGNPRPTPSGSKPDIGAYENPLGSPIVEMKDELKLKQYNFQLFQNYPNPFNPSTTITYQIPKAGFVTLRIYNFLGKEVTTAVEEYKPAGKYEFEFNGSTLPSGVYFYRINVNNFIQIKKAVLIK
jgi:parallel beta-helix repeat protein